MNGNSKEIPDGTSKMDMLGVKMDCLSYEDMFPIFDGWLKDKSSRSHTIQCINVYVCVSGLFNPDLRNIYNAADITGIDGMPFLKWARTFYNKRADRFYAPDLMLEISKKAEEKGYTFFLYGGYPGAPEKMEEYLSERYEGTSVIGSYSPPFRPPTEQEDQEICDMINRLQPDFVWVGLGTPKQDFWISEHRHKIRGSILVASGATFDFFSGNIKQAPKYIRNSGLEWLYRLTKDFRRLWVRYTVYNVIFLIFFVLQRLRILRFG